MGGKSTSTNSEVVNLQKQQAEEAKQKEAARQARLESGMSQINGIFDGIKPDFYNNYNKAQLDYYLPEEGRQYNKQRADANYALARSGTLHSSIAGDQMSDIEYQHGINRAQLTAQADTATAGLREQVASNKQAAINQLYSTEDPTLAANTATSLVKNTELTKPLLSAVGTLFSPIAIGTGYGLQSYGDAKTYGNVGATKSGQNYTTGG